jgi:hypothetical protein
MSIDEHLRERLHDAGYAFWGDLRDHLSEEACLAVEEDGLHPSHWAQAAECCVRVLAGQRDHRPHAMCSGMDLDPGQVVAELPDPIALAAEVERLRDLATRLAAIAPEGVDDASVAEANDLTSRAEEETS